ncbi:MAG: response regulator, partial [Ketobacter sp.]
IAVDDNPANLKLLCALLEDLQVTVTACDSGMKALQQIEQRDFDLVLMDIQMPVMDGVETAQRIRSMEGKEAHTPIIAVTAHALASEKHTLLNSGMDDYVTKPINEAQLIHIIHKWTGVNLHAEDDSESRTADENGGESAVDMKLGLKLANNKEDLAEEMLEMLFNALQKDKDTIRVLLEDEDYETLQEVVHKLHGATRYTGVPFLQEASQVLEENLKLEKFEAVKVLTNALLNEIERVIGWCEQNRDMAAH